MALRQLIRRSVREAGAAVLHYSGLRRGIAGLRRRQVGGRRVLIVGYHRVVEDLQSEIRRSSPAGLISTATFQRHLEASAAAGYEFSSIDDAVDVITGARAASRDLIVVTFDDGYRDIYRYAYPILKKMGVPAVLYIPAGMIGTEERFDHDRLFTLLRTAAERGDLPDPRALPVPAISLLHEVVRGGTAIGRALDDFIADNSSEVLNQVTEALSAKLNGVSNGSDTPGDIMSWEEARRMAADGFVFGAHTLRHVVLTLSGPETIEHEIAGSKELIERQLGTQVRHFSYCNGWYSEQIIRSLIRHGFRSAVTTEDLPNRIGGNPFTLKRKILSENFSVGATGQYSNALTACHMDDVFGVLGIDVPVIGHRPQRIHIPTLANQPGKLSGERDAIRSD